MYSTPATDYSLPILCGPADTGRLVWLAGQIEPEIIDSSGRILKVDECIRLLESRNPVERKVAICYLRELGDDRAVLPLLKVLRSSDLDLGSEAIYAISDIASGENRRRFFGNPYTLGEGVWKPQPTTPEGAEGFTVAVERLIWILRIGNPRLHYSAIQALAFLGDSRAVKPLMRALRSRDEDVRDRAAFALGRIGMTGDLRVVEPLIQALHDKQEGVRRTATFWLGMLKDKRATAPLIQVLIDTHRRDYEREDAAKALGELADLQALQVLLKVLRESGSMLGYHAGKAIVEIKETSVVPEVIDILMDKDSPGRGYAAWTLGNLGDERAVQPLIDVATNEVGQSVRWYALQGLAELKDRKAYDAAFACLYDEDDMVRSCAAQALGGIGDPRAVEPLVQALSDPSPDVREEIVQALGKLKDTRALEPLINTLLHDPGVEVRLYTAEALGWLGDARALPALEYAVEHDDGVPELGIDTVRSMAREAIEQIKGKRNVSGTNVP